MFTALNVYGAPNGTKIEAAQCNAIMYSATRALFACEDARPLDATRTLSSRRVYGDANAVQVESTFTERVH